MTRMGYRSACALASLALSATGANATQPVTVPANVPVYSVPMAAINGSGAITFHVMFGMLVGAKRLPVGLYRTYPSRSTRPLSEVYGLGMLGTPAGVILASYRDIPLLVLHGHISNAIGHHVLTLAYMTSLVPRRYATCAVDVVHASDGGWKIVNGAGNPVTHFLVVSRHFAVARVSPCVAAPQAPP